MAELHLPVAIDVKDTNRTVLDVLGPLPNKVTFEERKNITKKKNVNCRAKENTNSDQEMNETTILKD